MTVAAVPTTINGRWQLLLPEHRAARPQWGDWTDGNGVVHHGWEAERLDSMHARLRPGDVVYDVGAEEGDLPALWASWGCQVVLFEPNARVWPNIRFIFEANGLPVPLACWAGFAAERSGVGTKPTEVSWRTWPRCADGPVIGDHGFLNLCERPDVGRLALDDAAGFMRIPPPDAITIDVEGAELRVLRGASELLLHRRPLVWVSIHPEFMDEMYGDHPADLHAYMAEHGYEGQHLATDHEQHWLFRPLVPV